MLVLFICRANSKRSQVAAAFFNGMSKKNKAISAGLEVSKEGNEGLPINPFNVEIMKGMGPLKECAHAARKGDGREG
ncbi:MAG: hypothetical protein KGH61_05265 [Candidatus Micrarchaeota archaeon]|nr:hypothetical protein [Candidatus Micrarchaeota archaeon]MDE1848324.1 hypothetical protein [Candidatus Micrarchaeota archaeon]MDE1864913.1 hypothetical protein [Candidatus Micrarchaeota archaeon]